MANIIYDTYPKTQICDIKRKLTNPREKKVSNQ